MAGTFKTLTGRTQILTRPQMWIGSIDPIERKMFLFEDGKIQNKTIQYRPALLKVIDELLDNSLDAILSNKIKNAYIKVNITDNTVKIEDTGPGIEIRKMKKEELGEHTDLPEIEQKRILNTYIPELAFTVLFAGTNFDDKDDDEKIGRHGVGSKAANIFSKIFIAKTDDGKKSCKVVSKNNMETTKTTLGKTSGKTGTEIEFQPDLERFGLTKIEQIYKDLIYQRLLCLSLTLNEIKFYFNGKRINFSDKNFLKIFDENIIVQQFTNGFIGVYPNKEDEFNFFTYINGIELSQGGNHIDYISTEIIKPIKEKLEKKYKNIKPGDIRQRLSLIVFLRKFHNPKFDSQTKQRCTNSPSEIATQLKNNGVDFEDLSKKILKSQAIIDPIIETFKIKEELKTRQEFKKNRKIKISPDKFMPPIGEKKYCMITEGISARGNLLGALGREGIGSYGSRGVPLNCYSASTQKIIANAEVRDILNILELDFFSKDSKKTIAYDKVVIATDADCFNENTLIKTKNGIKKIKDLTYDDQILNGSNEYKNIKQIVKKVSNETILIKLGPDTLECSPNQILPIYRENKVIFIQAKNVINTDKFLKLK